MTKLMIIPSYSNRQIGNRMGFDFDFGTWEMRTWNLHGPIFSSELRVLADGSERQSSVFQSWISNFVSFIEIKLPGRQWWSQNRVCSAKSARGGVLDPPRRVPHYVVFLRKGVSFPGAKYIAIGHCSFSWKPSVRWLDDFSVRFLRLENGD